MTPAEKQAWRMAYAADVATGRAYMHHEHDAMVAEYRLSTEGVKPELVAYLRGLGRVFS